MGNLVTESQRVPPKPPKLRPIEILDKKIPSWYNDLAGIDSFMQCNKAGFYDYNAKSKEKYEQSKAILGPRAMSVRSAFFGGSVWSGRPRQRFRSEMHGQ
jgi:hypothetical protein